MKEIPKVHKCLVDLQTSLKELKIVLKEHSCTLTYEFEFNPNRSKMYSYSLGWHKYHNSLGTYQRHPPLRGVWPKVQPDI